MIAASFSVAINTDIPSLIGGDAEIVSLARKSSNTLRVLCDTPAAVEAAKSVFDFDTPIDPKSMYMLLSEKGEGVLGDKARRLLGDGETKKIERAAKRRDFMGVGLFPKAIDPYYFLNDFVLELKAYKPELPEGAELLYGSCRGKGSSVKTKNLLSLAKKRRDIHLSGSPFHTLIATERTKREVNFLGVISIAAVFVLGFLLARTWRIFPLLFLALTLGFAAAILVVILVFKSIHIVTILFGTSLIGLGVDYCYHGFMEPEKKKELTSALVTTSLAFVPLFFSGVAALSQMALFTIVGIVVIYIFVILTADRFAIRKDFGQKILSSPREYADDKSLLPELPKTTWQILKGIAFVALIAFSGPMYYDNSPDAFYKPDSFLAENEEAVKKVSNPDSLGFSLVDLEDWQRENLELKKKLRGVGDVAPYQPLITSSDLPPQMTVNIGGRSKLILPGERNLKDELEKLLNGFALKSYYGLVLAVLAITLVAIVIYRFSFLRIVGPIIAALILTFCTLPIFGEKINFFHILSLFIVMGLGIDYSIFHFQLNHRLAPRPNKTVVFFSFLTSLLGFGLLGLTSFPVTRSMGLTIALGLVYSYLLSLPSKKSPSSINTPAGAWHSQSEQSAGKLRIMLIFWIYKYLGKSAAKLLFFPAFLFIYPFCRPAKAALEDFYRVTGLKGSVFKQLLSFAWSMIDKTDACSLNKNPPKIKLKGDLDWMKGGCFLLSTHLGCIEVLPALRSEYPGASKVNAFQQLGHDAVFTEIFLKYMDKDQLTLHAVEDIGVETAANMKEAIERGEIVLMAGDRPSAGSKAVLKHKFFGHVCEWPKGVFRFAKLMESPVYAITMVKTGWSSYEVHAKKLDVSELLPQYVEFLESEVSAYPEQWYNFYQYFR
ncbi:MAG: hypothetical protein MJ109_04905 [Kiritimatiellae bacterium]|nr:hypothetical protein [Kiritimatiellia bacterium]